MPESSERPVWLHVGNPYIQRRGRLRVTVLRETPKRYVVRMEEPLRMRSKFVAAGDETHVPKYAITFEATPR